MPSGGKREVRGITAIVLRIILGFRQQSYVFIDIKFLMNSKKKYFCLEFW